jgi:hypothetical protein
MIAAIKLLAKLLSDRIIRIQYTAFLQKNEMLPEKTDDKYERFGLSEAPCHVPLVLRCAGSNIAGLVVTFVLTTQPKSRFPCDPNSIGTYSAPQQVAVDFRHNITK